MKITIGNETAIALHEACSVIGLDDPKKLALLAIDAVCQEVVNQGGMIVPMAVTLRSASDDEIAARLVTQ